MKKAYQYYLLIFIIFSAAFSTVYYFDYSLELQNLQIIKKNTIAIQKKIISEDILSLFKSIKAISKDERFLDILKTKNKKETTDLFKTFLKYAPNSFYQVRFLDMNGREVIRVDKIKEKILVTPEDKLQDKSNRDYFITAKRNFPDKEYLLTSIDLNKEWGKIEIPHRPTIRLLKAVKNERNQLQGIIILNYWAETFLSFLKDQDLKDQTDFFILNNEGYWILDIDKKGREYGHLIPERNHYHFFNIFKFSPKLSLESFTMNHHGSFYFTNFSINDLLIKNELPHKNVSWQEGWILGGHTPYSEIGLGAYKIESYLTLYLLTLSIVFLLTHFTLRERKRKEEQAKLNKQLFTITEDCIIMTDERGLITQLNKNALLLLDGREEDLIGQDLNKFYPYNDQQIKDRQNTSNDIITNLKGVKVPIRSTFNQIDLGNKLGFIIYIMDIRAENKTLKITQQELKIKNDFIALVAHDIKAPISTITSLVDIFRLKETKLSKETEGILDDIQNLCERGLSLVTDILLNQRSNNGNLQLIKKDFSLKKLFAQLEAEFAFKFKNKGIRFSVVSNNDFQINGDLTLIRQVITNLLSNAFKFCEPGNTVKLSADTKDGKFCSIYVSDNGKGIKESVLTNLFTPKDLTLSTGSQGETGTGFGLPFCYQIISAHQGLFKVKSKLGEGTEFEIILPIQKDPTP